MFTHQEIWDAIDILAENNDLSTSGLAKKAGLDSTTFNKSKRVTAGGKLRWPSTESISKILFVTGVNFSEFVGLIDNQNVNNAIHKDNIPYFRDLKSIEDYIRSGHAETAENYAVLPEKSQRVISFEITDKSLEPAYERGHLFILDLDCDYNKDDTVLICNSSKHLYVAKIIRETVETFYLKSCICDKTFELSKKECLWNAKILWYSQ